jgi:hypothetical protein
LKKDYLKYIPTEILAKDALSQHAPDWTREVSIGGFPPWQYVARVLAERILNDK